MQLQLKNCIIREFSLADAESVQRHANNRKIWQNLREVFPHPYTIENAKGFLNFITNAQPQTTFAIAAEKEAIGCIGLQLGADVHRRTAELGYWLSEQFWDHGIMTEAVIAFTKWGFENFELDRIFAQPFSNNLASARVMEKAGFVREGVLRANVFKDGNVLDSLLYARYRNARG